MIPAIATLIEGIEELDAWCDYHEDKVPEELLPSALMLAVDPRSTPNATARISGDPEHLVQALLVAARGNEAFREALVNALPQLLNLAN
jgi:hypothetical protein